jgi:hypothetical protein
MILMTQYMAEIFVFSIISCFEVSKLLQHMAAKLSVNIFIYSVGRE